MTPAHPSDTPAFSHYGGRPATPAGLTRAPAPRGGRGGSGGDMLDSLMGDLTDSHSTASIYAELQPPSPQGTSSLALVRKGEPAAKKMWAGLDRGLRLLQARLHPRSNFFPVSSTCGCLERHAFACTKYGARVKPRFVCVRRAAAGQGGAAQECRAVRCGLARCNRQHRAERGPVVHAAAGRNPQPAARAAGRRAEGLPAAHLLADDRALIQATVRHPHCTLTERRCFPLRGTAAPWAQPVGPSWYLFVRLSSLCPVCRFVSSALTGMLLLLLGDYYRVQLEIARLESNVPTLQIWHRKKMLVTGPLRTVL